MCIAIVKPKDKTISRETLEICYEANPDGIGFAYCKDGNIFMNKYIDKFDEFYEDYSKVETTSPMLIHFRIATHGGVNIENCHPFKLNNRMVLIHNGVISGYGNKTDKSDTRDFIEQVIGNISHKQWKNASFRKLVGEAIGYSKFGILDVDGNTYIINEDRGTWYNGVWYSNNSYKPKVVTTKTSGTTNGYATYDDWYRTKKYKSHFVCNSCKKKFLVDGYTYYAECPHCKSADTNQIGYQVSGKDYMYNDYTDDTEWCYCY